MQILPSHCDTRAVGSASSTIENRHLNFSQFKRTTNPEPPPEEDGSVESQAMPPDDGVIRFSTIREQSTTSLLGNQVLHTDLESQDSEVLNDISLASATPTRISVEIKADSLSQESEQSKDAPSMYPATIEHLDEDCTRFRNQGAGKTRAGQPSGLFHRWSRAWERTPRLSFASGRKKNMIDYPEPSSMDGSQTMHSTGGQKSVKARFCHLLRRWPH